MSGNVQKFIPPVTSQAGRCLTSANWQEVGIDTIVCHLDALLIKPGYSLLMELKRFNDYINWHGAVILNAKNLKANKEGIYTLLSPYDGSKVKLSAAEIISLILSLKPKAVLLPAKIMKQAGATWNDWDEAIMPFFTVNDVQIQPVQCPHGVYFDIESTGLSEPIVQQVKAHSHLPRYATGLFDKKQISQLNALEIDYIETNRPANDAYQGHVYSQEGFINIAEEDLAQQFETIDSRCHCPTCTQQLTKAYLHHLFLHTPLLCQRLLIQHNIHYAQQN